MNWDPGLVIRVFRTVNSAAFGLRQPVDSIEHAVTLLGRSHLEQLVISIAVKDSLPKPTTPAFDSDRFWRTAFFRASLARSISQRLNPSQQAISFTAGLLQDMAVPLLAHSRPDYGRVLQEWHASPSTSLHEVEREALGWSHCQAGGLLAIEWELPESVAQAIHLHHDDHAADDQILPALRLVSLHRETETEHGIEALIETARSRYGLEPDWMQRSVEECEVLAAELSRST